MKSRCVICTVLFACLIICLQATVNASDAVAIPDVIAIREQANPEETFAAKELADYLCCITRQTNQGLK